MVRVSSKSSNPGPNRSVVDYASPNKLRHALAHYPPAVAEESESSDDDQVKDDWILPSFNPETTETQSMEEEIKRLMVLKSYLILDSEREIEFERITRIAARTFDVPIALVSLVDIGRQWFMSNRGLPEHVRETPRKFAFCSHVIQAKFSPEEQEKRQNDQFSREQPLHPMLIVPDATKDPRFCNNPLVTGPPDIRFYAGSPLISPEGYKLGTLCIIDNRVRPDGLSDDEREILQDMAAMVVHVMVSRKQRFEAESMLKSPEQIIACTAHDLMTPLSGIQLSLSLLSEDEELKQIIGPFREELIHTAASSSELLRRICQQSIDGLRDKLQTNGLCTGNITTTLHSGHTVMAELIRSLHMIMDPIQKAVPIIITLDKEVPATIRADDLKLFRSALNLLSNAATRTSSGRIHLRIYLQNTDHLVFECEDTGTNIDEKDYPYMFQDSQMDSEVDPQQLALTSVASLVSSMNGDYGFRARSVDKDGKACFDSKGRRQQGSVFWFSVPVLSSDDASLGSNSSFCLISKESSMEDVVKAIENEEYKERLANSNSSIAYHSGLLRRYAMTPEPINKENDVESLDTKMKKSLSVGNIKHSVSVGNIKNKKPVRVDSYEQAASISSSCLGAVFDPIVRPKPIKVGPATTPEIAVPNAQWSPSSYAPDKTVSANRISLLNGGKNFHASNEKSVILDGLEIFEKDPIGHVFSNQSIMNQNGQTPINLEQGMTTDSKANNDVPTERNQKLNGHVPIHKELSTTDASICSTKPLDKTTSTPVESKNLTKTNIPTDSKENGSNKTLEPTTSRTKNEKARRKRALVIDDSIIIRKTLTRGLNKIGFDDVVLAEDGLEGLNELKKQMFDLVLCDFLMPTMDGMDCVRQYRAWEEVNRSTFRQLIIGMSAHANANDGGQGIKVGMDDFKAKPITIQLLGEIVKSDCCMEKSNQLDVMEKQILTNGSNGQLSMVDLKKNNNNMTPDIGDNKRQRQEQTCLIGSDSPRCTINEIILSLEGLGWKVVVVQDGLETLTQLQVRNWDLVLMDDDLSNLPNGRSCIKVFREWEVKNRVNGQRNVFLLCDGDIPSPCENVLIQAPCGYDGVLRKPVPWNDLHYIVQQRDLNSNNKKPESTMNIICR